MRSNAAHAFWFALVYLALAVTVALGAEWRDIELLLPRELGRGDAAFLQVELGTLPRGREVHLTTASGRELGVISPYAMPAGRDAGIYNVPVPSDVFVERRLIVRLSLNTSDRRERAPTADEVKNVWVKIVPVAR
ncbi:MAG TPA: hypothetical protein VH188_09560 [Chthoniobacterales bacterium]|jgi:hypothetical protein|nr:hypothetical protein [Chthoniobacterales bacterium]